jgi:TctA family transporter
MASIVECKNAVRSEVTRVLLFSVFLVAGRVLFVLFSDQLELFEELFPLADGFFGLAGLVG